MTELFKRESIDYWKSCQKYIGQCDIPTAMQQINTPPYEQTYIHHADCSHSNHINRPTCSGLTIRRYRHDANAGISII